MIETNDASQTDYRNANYTVIRSLLGEQLLAHVVAYANILGQIDRFTPDPSIEDSLRCYGDPGFDALLVALRPQVEAAVGVQLIPTYSYARVYYRGHVLERHRDRPACEHSVTLHLDSSKEEVWPIQLLQADGAVRQLALGPGDGLAYRGMDVLHWREACPCDWYVQLFLHYVDADGDYAGQAFDGRPSLGVPRRGDAGV